MAALFRSNADTLGLALGAPVMDEILIPDPRFREAIAALDAGDLPALERHLAAHPGLVRERLATGEGYFANPYLLWFVAENPIRTGRLAPNVVEMARAIVEAAERNGVETLGEQLSYTLGLVCSGSVSRESGVQIPLIDFLLEAGAEPDGAMLPALAHGERAAVDRLLERGATVTLLAAACLGKLEDAERLAPLAGREELQAALSGAALWGQAEIVRLLIAQGVDLAATNPPGLHAHSTPLHQAVDSGSLETVRILVEAGAPLDVRDRLFDGTPCGWADYLGRTEIAAYLRSVQG